MTLLKLGYGGQVMAIAFTTMKNRYPEAHEAFIKELVIRSLARYLGAPSAA